MAPARATRKQPAREEDYSNIGVAGRKTGITLKDSGIRDEHGLEPIDGIFSSPERPKSTRKTNGNTSSTITEDESMEIGQSTIPEPTEILNNRRVTLPPPRSRSPLKTNLGSSPRRSVGPPSSPLKQLPTRLENGTGSSDRSSPRLLRPSPRPSARQMSRDPDDSIAAVSPVKSAKRKKEPIEKVATSSETANHKRRKIFDIEVTDDEGADETAESIQINETVEENATDNVEDSLMADAADDSLPMEVLEDVTMDESALDQSLEMEQEAQPSSRRGKASKAAESPAQPTKRKPGRPKKGGRSSVSLLEEAVSAPQQPSGKGRRGRPPRSKVEEEVLEVAAKNKVQGKATKRAPTRAAEMTPEQTPEVEEPQDVEDLVETIEEIPAKKGKKDTASKPRKKPPPSQRSRGARISSSGEFLKASAAASSAATTTEVFSSSAQQAEASTSTTTVERGKPRARGLLMMRSETPAEDHGAQVLRSGRTSVKPLAYWRSERIVYGESRKEGDRLSLPGIKEVIRTEEMAPPPSRRRGASKANNSRGGGGGGGGASRRGQKQRQQQQADIEEEDEEAEAWELDTGVAGGDVMMWDAVNQRVSEHDLEEIELAYAPKGLSSLMREVKAQTFLYGKTVTLPFFHSGIVDLPPGGEKRMKNSRKNHMVFWVFTGRVDVNVSNNEFSVGAGAMWQVPRGNFYSLQNPYARPSRVFFAQGCHMDGREEDRFEGAGGAGGAGGVNGNGVGEEAGAGGAGEDDGAGRASG